MTYTGTVARWNGQKGYGFITCSEFENDVFVHFSAFGGGDLIQGSTVQFDLEDEQNGKQHAINVTGQGVESSRRFDDNKGGSKGFGSSKGGKGSKGKGSYKGNRDYSRGYDDYQQRSYNNSY